MVSTPRWAPASAKATLHCRIDEEVLGLLRQYHYSGNIRELRSVIQSAVNLAQGGAITSDLLPAPFRENQKTRAASPPDDDLDAGLSLADREKTYLLKVYRQLNQNKSRTARRLGIGLNTLRRKLKAHGVA
jgi:transcriptional regulator with PAS, ATPase and Fis domain